MTLTEKKTFRLHLIYSFFEGFIMGVLSLNEFILLRSMRGTNYEIATLVQFSVLVLLFSTVVNEFLKRVQNKKSLLRYIALFTRMPLFFLFFFPSNTYEIANNSYHIIFLSIFFVYYIAHPFVLPTINLFLKNAYSHQNFGKLYGYASTLNKIVILFATFFIGLWLDFDYFAFRYIYPIIGILGITSIFVLTKIDYTESVLTEIKPHFLNSVKNSFTDIYKILKHDRPYFHFQLGFMLYGFVWIGTMAAISIFFDQVLHLNYTSVAFYKNSYNLVAIIVLPFFGKLIGRTDPRKFGIYTFGTLLIFLVFLTLTEFFPFHVTIWGIKIYYILILAYISYGIFAATMALLWYIGSAYFCKKEDAANYQSVHLSLTGVRGVIAPVLGIAIYEWIDFKGVFGIGIVILLFSIAVMIFSLKKIPKISIKH
jgi:hypothetical protein